ncbi:MAG: PAS domain S-box protein [Halofilum sp. (in: g-proteobacteria)]|nr:PAS domain S-box protein [Halofilum sp. (in: g-proteobacteria)]
MRQYRSLIEASSDQFAIVDENYRLRLVNQAYAAALGMERHELEGAHAPQVLGEQYFDTRLRARHEACFAGEPQVFEVERNYAGVGTRQLLVRYYPISDMQQETRLMGAVITDVTALKHAEARLREQAHLVDMAGRITRLGGWSAELESGRVSWSPVVAEIHGMHPGYSPASVAEAIDFYPPEYRERIEMLVRTVAEQGTVFDEELQIVDRQGRRVSGSGRRRARARRRRHDHAHPGGHPGHLRAQGGRARAPAARRAPAPNPGDHDRRVLDSGYRMALHLRQRRGRAGAPATQGRAPRPERLVRVPRARGHTHRARVPPRRRGWRGTDLRGVLRAARQVAGDPCPSLGRRPRGVLPRRHRAAQHDRAAARARGQPRGLARRARARARHAHGADRLAAGADRGARGRRHPDRDQRAVARVRAARAADAPGTRRRPELPRALRPGDRRPRRGRACGGRGPA